MKKLIIAIILAAGVQLSHAQISIDPEMGLNFFNLAYSSGSNSGSFFHHQPAIKTGALATFHARSGFFVQTGLFYSVKGSKLSNEDGFLKFKGSIRLNYMEVPLNIGYKYKMGPLGALFATAGPYIGYALSGSINETDYLNGVYRPGLREDIAFSSSGIHRWDLGFNFGLGYQLPIGIFVKAQYGLGVSHVVNGFLGTAQANRGYSFTVGYDIKLPSTKKQSVTTK